MQTFRPYDTFANALRWWPLMVACAILGVLVALGFSALSDPIYEARAEITINIDLTRTGILTQEETDMAINATGSVIDSSDLRLRLLSDAQAAGIDIPAEKAASSLFVERKAESYALRVLLTDPQQAAWVANRWAELALADLQSAQEHAVMAEAYQRTIDGLSACIQQSALDNTSLCGSMDLPALQAVLKQNAALLAEERLAARALFPGLRASYTRAPILPTEAVNYNRKWMLLAGALLGLALGILIIGLNLPARFERSRARA